MVPTLILSIHRINYGYYSVIIYVAINVDIFELLPTKMIYIQRLRSLIFTDVHVGVEFAFAEQGSFIPPIQYRKIKTSIIETIKSKKPKRIIILGDLKHTFQRKTLQEHQEVIDLLEMLSSLGKELILVRGNHDTFIRGILQSYGVEVLDYLQLGGILFIHGHKKAPDELASESRFIVMGHIHPTVTISDGISRYKFPCFLIEERIVILPALTPLLPGLDIVSKLMSLPEYESPIIQNIENFKVYIVVDEKRVFDMGTIKALRSIFLHGYSDIAQLS